MTATRSPSPEEQQRRQLLVKLINDCRLNLKPENFPPPPESPGGPRKRKEPSKEVTLADIARRTGYSPNWIGQLANGKKVKFTDHFLDVFAKTLEMDDGQRTMLFDLAGQKPRARRAPEKDLQDSRIFKWMLNDWSSPACAIDSAWNILGHNRPMQQWFSFVTSPRANFMWWAFTSAAARRTLYNFDEEWGPQLWAEMQFNLAQQPDNIKLSTLNKEILKHSVAARRISQLPLAYVNPDGDRRRLELPGGKIIAAELVVMMPLRATRSRVMTIIELDDTQH